MLPSSNRKTTQRRVLGEFVVWWRWKKLVPRPYKHFWLLRFLIAKGIWPNKDGILLAMAIESAIRAGLPFINPHNWPLEEYQELGNNNLRMRTAIRILQSGGNYKYKKGRGKSLAKKSGGS